MVNPNAGQRPCRVALQFHNKDIPMHTPRHALIAALALAPVFAAQAAEQAKPVRHANGEHPAVLVARQTQAVNPNTYLVQPPVAVQWTVQAEPKMLAAADTQATLAK
jgi:hypothetical protein